MPEPALRLPLARPQRPHPRVPGDKSISHRALMLGALAIGETRIDRPARRRGRADTADAMARARRRGRARRRRRAGGSAASASAACSSPTDALDFGNSGTGARLIMGDRREPRRSSRTFDRRRLAAQRPMGRVLDPLERMGASSTSAEGDRLPLTLARRRASRCRSSTAAGASAQVKSAVLLAGLNTAGHHGDRAGGHARPHRAHAARLRRRVDSRARGRRRAGASPSSASASSTATRVAVPGDPSSAAFPLVAALIVPGSDVVHRKRAAEPDPHRAHRDARSKWAPTSTIDDRAESGGEAVADIRVRALRAQGRRRAGRARALDDRRISVLAVAAAFAEGETRMEGLARAAGEGKRPAGRDCGRARGQRRRRRRRATIWLEVDRRARSAAAAWSRPISTTASPWPSWSWAWLPRNRSPSTTRR